MKRSCGAMLLAMTIVLPAAAGEGPPLALAVDGEARLPIVLSPQAGKPMRQLADELAEYLGRVTGGRFEIKTGDGAEGIVLGTLAEFPSPDLAVGLQIRDTYDGREAFAIRTDARRLRLLGATELGASHAVFRFLESLGCRWLFPARGWEVVPRRPTLAVAMAETDRPTILARRIWWGWGFFDHQRAKAEYDAWARHNRMAASFTVSCGHAWQTIIAENQKLFDAKPEYLALVGGKRTGPQFCVSRPEVRRLALDHAIEYFRRYPLADMVSLETSDGSGHCECEACRRLGNVSDRAFGLGNEVAQALAHRLPGKMVGMLAYNDHCEPPSFPLEPNVYIQSTAGFIRGKYTFDELQDVWPTRCRRMGFYEYLSVWQWDFDMPPGGRGANLGYLRRQIPRYVACRATSLDCESGNNWGLHGLGYYVANRLMWNPKADVDALLADFFQQAFGPAAVVMRRYYERLDPGGEPLMSEHLLALALRDLDEASRQAAAAPEVTARLDHLKQYQHYVRLRWEFDRSGDKARRRELALAILTHVYRTRYSYMNHWEAIRQHWTPLLAKMFDEPDWAFNARGGRQPWKQETPPTHDETERLFQEDLAYFRPQPVEEKTFSASLVPGGFHTEHPAAGSQRFQGGARYAWFSRKGQPLVATITTGVIAWYRDHAEAAYTLTDAEGKKIAAGRLPQDGGQHRLQIAVPRPGLYWLEFNDQSAGWGIAAAEGEPLVLALVGSHPHHLGHMQRMFFFVPIGTKEVHYFWDGPPHEVFGPDGRLLQKVDQRGRFIRIAVPAGADGKVWSLGKLCLGRLRFLNVPNYLAASPDALLVPGEVAPDHSPSPQESSR